MHEVSPQTIQAAQKHALELIEQGKHIADVAQKLKNGDSREVELAQRLKSYAETIQEHAHKSLDLAESLESNSSTEVLSASAQEHVEAAKAYMEAIKVFQQSNSRLEATFLICLE